MLFTPPKKNWKINEVSAAVNELKKRQALSGYNLDFNGLPSVGDENFFMIAACRHTCSGRTIIIGCTRKDRVAMNFPGPWLLK
ncbi:hypothetical protein ABDD95_07010 [Mucilaginibacter sp. PAMB04274]|uniref:hypothetical protein n=1 Tax=Mucilaginibacter sp. PAMB04274 TaxID=3138568 RepID=UPI0031F605ED